MPVDMPAFKYKYKQLKWLHFSCLYLYLNAAISGEFLPSQPFLGRHLGFLGRHLGFLNFYHHSHFLAATLDFSSFFTIAFLRAAHFFYSFAVLD